MAKRTHKEYIQDQEDKKSKRLSEGKAVKAGKWLDERVDSTPDPRLAFKDPRVLQTQANTGESARMRERSAGMLRALRDTGPSLAEFSGDRQKRQALADLASQEASARGNSGAALAAMLSDRAQSRASGDLGERIAQARSAEVNNMTGALGQQLAGVRGQYMDMQGLNDNYARNMEGMSAEYKNQLLNEALARKLQNEKGQLAVELAKLGRTPSPGAAEVVMNQIGQLAPYAVQALQGAVRTPNEVTQEYYQDYGNGEDSTQKVTPTYGYNFGGRVW